MRTGGGEHHTAASYAMGQLMSKNSLTWNVLPTFQEMDEKPRSSENLIKQVL